MPTIIPTTAESIPICPKYNSRYVANPKKVLRQLLLDGKYPEVTKGKIVAGDAVELDVMDSLSMKGNTEKRFQLHQPSFDKL